MSTVLRLTAAEFDRMIEQGVFAEDRRIELIEGELREMTPPGPTHEEVVDELNEWSLLSVPLDKVRVRVQNTVGIPELDSIPLPDITWVRRKSYRRSRPRVSDVLLLIEASDSTLAYDCGEKAILYARAGIKDYWVADIRHQTIEVFREPSPDGYDQRQSFDVTMSVRPLAFPELVLPVARLYTFGWKGD